MKRKIQKMSLRIQSQRVRFRILLQHTNPRGIYEIRHNFLIWWWPMHFQWRLWKRISSTFREGELSSESLQKNAMKEKIEFLHMNDT